MNYDAIIIGGGAAGLFCAGEAAKLGKRILILEKAATPGKKILISGGGRCNFTNIRATAAQYISQNPHFAKSALARYTPHDFLGLVENAGISWHEKTLGQLFCDGSSRQILDMLLARLTDGVTLLCDQDISMVSREGDGFCVTSSGANYAAKSLVLASGGPSIPKMGASGYAYEIARQFGLKIVEPRPALVPLTLGGDDALFRDLSGVSAPVVARCGRVSFDEAALFTHRGLSGPAILQISSYWRRGEHVHINFLPDHAQDTLLAAKRNSPSQHFASWLGAQLPHRLADILTERLGLVGDLGNISDAALRAATERLMQWPFSPNGTEGFAKAEVTLGGISTAELSSQTMEAKKIPGLFAIGECVDVTGWLGGYNFQWAWASAHAAAQHL